MIDCLPKTHNRFKEWRHHIGENNTIKINSESSILTEVLDLYDIYEEDTISRYKKSFGRKNQIDRTKAEKNIKKLNKKMTALPPVEGRFNSWSSLRLFLDGELIPLNM